MKESEFVDMLRRAALAANRAANRARYAHSSGHRLGPALPEYAVERAFVDQLRHLTAQLDGIGDALKPQAPSLDWDAYFIDAELSPKGRDEIHQRLWRIVSLQLTQRFGELPQAVVERLDHASFEELVHWGGRLVLAPTLEDVFDDR